MGVNTKHATSKPTIRLAQEMGTFSVPISIGDPQGENWIELDALVDTGASVTSVPGSILRELGNYTSV